MFIVIDAKDWHFLPIAHPDMHVVGNLVWIEAPTFKVHIERIEWPFLTTLTDIQLVLLYQNTTGEKTFRSGDYMRSILMEIAERIPAREVNAFELDKQAELVPEKGSARYLYAKGQFTPAKQKKDFLLQPLLIPKSPDEAAIAARPRVRPVHAIAPRTLAPVPASGSARPARAPGAPRQAGVRELIWAVADRMWEAAGKPESIPTVLILRKSIMNTLESENGVKRTSSSNELGQWMKARISQ